MRGIYEKLIAPHEVNLGWHDSYGLDLICSENKYAFFGSTNLLITSRHPHCSFTLVPRAYYAEMFTVATAKRSSFHGILKFR